MASSTGRRGWRHRSRTGDDVPLIPPLCSLRTATCRDPSPRTRVSHMIIGFACGVGSLLATLGGPLTVIHHSRLLLLAISAPRRSDGEKSSASWWYALREAGPVAASRRAHRFDDETARRQDDPLSFGEAWRTGTTRSGQISACLSPTVGRARRWWSAGLGSAGTLAPGHYHTGLDAIHRGLLVVPGAVFTLVGGFIGGGLIDAFGRRAPASVLRTVGHSALCIGASGAV